MGQFRKVEAKRQGPVFTAAMVPRLEMVPIGRLVIDDSYQRPMSARSHAAVARIARHFRWSRFSPLLVAPVQGGLFAIIDGQHRAHAAAARGIDAVPAMIVEMSAAEQADAFAAVNGERVSVTSQQVYKAALAAGEGWALRARAAVEAGGCTLMTYNRAHRDRKGGEVYDVRLIRRMVEAGDDAVVTRGLSAIRTADEAGEPEMYLRKALEPWFRIVATAEFAGAELVGFLRAHPLDDIVERAIRLRLDPPWKDQPQPQVVHDAIRTLLRAHLRGRAAA
jgi:hypothetical protein